MNGSKGPYKSISSMRKTTCYTYVIPACYPADTQVGIVEGGSDLQTLGIVFTTGSFQVRNVRRIAMDASYLAKGRRSAQGRKSWKRRVASTAILESDRWLHENTRLMLGQFV